MTLKNVLFGGALALLSAAPALADLYPSTLTPGSRLVHEFRDTQKESWPSGERPAYTTSSTQADGTHTNGKQAN
ncbi:hypothetical protein [Ancylobacter amanitiformis]|uniref:Uncharacterized protein n=1 Tax=Ancylobacter amanitiformis TaxID=217069 RepID=A0ABU0LWX4_9HYPH|nr:hypothetical protein [Ancylobacter amanitiformis]MDQ0513183.1 hypothetical protein [Ancylobacter amanitiformis]